MPFRRPYQDYGSWTSMGTRPWWADMAANRELAGEYIAQRMSSMNCINPSEQSSADFTAGALVAQYGNAAGYILSKDQIESKFNWMKVRIKQLSKHAVLDDYIDVLPASAAQLLRSYPRTASRHFDNNEHLPVSSPFNAHALSLMRSRIKCRLHDDVPDAISRPLRNLQIQYPNSQTMPPPGLYFCTCK